MKVTFANFGADVASSRLRAKIPQNEFQKMGIKSGRDVLVYGKHFVTEKQLEHFGRWIFDVCDDHFQHPELGGYYRKHVHMADAVTCNSEVMQQRIKKETGRDAIIVREPYESEEKEAGIAGLLLWFGHGSNFKDIERLKPFLHHPLLILSNYPGYPEWSLESFDRAISAPCIVVIPTGKSMAKSENRMVESIRRGRYVCAEHLPSYEQFGQFMPLGNIPEHIESALANPADSIRRIKDAQDYIRDRYSPKTIAHQWLEVINNVHH